MERSKVLSIIEEAFAARMRGDVEAAAKFFAPGATFRFAAEETVARAYLDEADDQPLDQAIARIIEQVTMPARETLSAVIEGNRCALISRATVSFGGGEPFETTLLDLFELDDQGRIVSVVEFADTARIAAEVARMRPG